MSSLTDLTDKVAIITGAVGIGSAIAFRLGEAGAKIVIASRNEAEARGTAAELSKKGIEAKSIQTDVAIESDVQKMVKDCLAWFGKIDILVNNAGIYPSIPLVDMTSENFDQVIAVNLRGVFLCTKYVSQQMIAQGHGGKIINITSIDSVHPSSIGLSHYDASKHGVWGFTKNVALELAPHKISVNAIAPGAIATPGVEKMQKSPAGPGVDMTKVMEKFLDKIPMHRMGQPDDVGKVALFLASDMSSYMTGAQIVVDGGVLLS